MVHDAVTFFVHPTLFFFVAFFFSVSVLHSFRVFFLHIYSLNHITVAKFSKWNLFEWHLHLVFYLRWNERERKLFTQTHFVFSAGVIGEWNSTTQNDVIVGVLKLNLCQMLPIHTLALFWCHELRHVAIKLNYSIF